MSPIHQKKPDTPKNLHPAVDVIHDLMESVIHNMRDKPVANIRLVGIQQVDHLTVVRGRFKEDFAYEKGFIAILKPLDNNEYQILDLIIAPGFEE